jgi:hypothetical protein
LEPRPTKLSKHDDEDSDSTELAEVLPDEALRPLAVLLTSEVGRTKRLVRAE